MTTYHRSGHWRISVNGVRHWVEGHEVSRYDWNHISYGAERSSSSWPTRPEAFNAGGLIAPNARCPVCGAEVFFYSNEFGSRVFFDDLGPPWPKHPCTDTVTGAPMLRELARIHAASTFTQRQLARWQTPDQAAWVPVVAGEHFRSGNDHFDLHVDGVRTDRHSVVVFAGASLPRRGDILWLMETDAGLRISWLATETLAPIEVPAEWATLSADNDPDGIALTRDDCQRCAARAAATQWLRSIALRQGHLVDSASINADADRDLDA